jgi:protein-S-isoprenylcysteine O-methyltransferase Ste14
MTKTSAAIRSALFFLIAPGTVVGVIPWWLSRWKAHTPFFGITSLPYCGVALICIGIAVLFDCFVRFVTKGQGTPAPTMPTQLLVVEGLYRYTRNPMYLGITFALLGQGLLLANMRVIAFATISWLVTHFFVLFYEEPRLTKEFGGGYLAYLSNVPRWNPRCTPWK